MLLAEMRLVEWPSLGLRKLAGAVMGNAGGVLDGSISMMLARRKSAWWKASCRCAA